MTETLTIPLKPTDFAEDRIITAILDGTFPPDHELPNQHFLSAEMGIARPSLREAVQRLASDGWISIQHGKTSRVKDIWTEGGLNILAGLIKHPDQMPSDFILKLLEIRSVIAPDYAGQAIEKHQREVQTVFKEGIILDDTPKEFAQFDWKMHRHLALLSDNFIYPLLLNSFAGFYENMALIYYEDENSRQASFNFHKQLHDLIQQEQDIVKVRKVFTSAMIDSIENWKNAAGGQQKNGAEK